MTEPREEIVKKAFLQFLNRGYKACSLKTLEQATGLTKGAFYYYFKDKKEILEAGMERYFSVMKEESGKDVERVASLREYIDLVIKNKEESADASQRVFGCFYWKSCFSSWCWKWPRSFRSSGSGYTRFPRGGWRTGSVLS